MIEYLSDLAAHNTTAVQAVGFLIAFVESLAVLGTLVPGSLTMLPFGIMLGSGKLPIISTVILMIFGAFLGDCVSYYVGYHFKDQLKNWSFFKKRPDWIDIGKKFIKDYGGSSIIIGRFVGPLRSSVPLIAGALHMKQIPFVLAAIPSVIIWAIVYLAPGFILTKYSAELGYAHWILLASMITFFIILCAHNTSHKVLRYIMTSPYINLPTHLVGTCWTILVIMCIYLMLSSVVSLGLLQSTNLHIDPWMNTVRTPLFVSIAKVFSISADKKALFVMSTLGALIMLITKNYRRLILLIIPILIQVAIVESSKILIACPRPSDIFTSYSFPSGHISAAIVLSYAIYQIVLTNQQQWVKNTVAILLSIWCIGVSLSQLILKAHWIFDFVGALLASTLVISIYNMILSTVPKPKTPLSQPVLIWLLVAAILSQSTMVYALFDKGRYQNIEQVICLKTK